jgi:hypothetical protein
MSVPADGWVVARSRGAERRWLMADGEFAADLCDAWRFASEQDATVVAVALGLMVVPVRRLTPPFHPWEALER